MRRQQTGDLYRDFFASLRRTLDAGVFGHISAHGKADAAQRLNAFRDGVHQVDLLAKMLVEQKMQLVERWPGHLPMALFIEIAQRGGVGQDQVQLLHHLGSGLLVETERQVGDHLSELLRLRPGRMPIWCVEPGLLPCHLQSLVF